MFTLSANHSDKPLGVEINSNKIPTDERTEYSSTYLPFGSGFLEVGITIFTFSMTGASEGTSGATG